MLPDTKIPEGEESRKLLKQNNHQMADPFEEEIGGFGEDDPESTAKKSERKRQREKQRRSDLANAFEELGQLLSQIDPEDSDNQHNRRRRRRSGGGDDFDNTGETAGMTRLDLIGRTIDALRRLHQENTNLRRTVEKQRRDAAAGGDDKVCRRAWFLRLHLSVTVLQFLRLFFRVFGVRDSPRSLLLILFEIHIIINHDRRMSLSWYRRFNLRTSLLRDCMLLLLVPRGMHRTFNLTCSLLPTLDSSSHTSRRDTLLLLILRRRTHRQVDSNRL